VYAKKRQGIRGIAGKPGFANRTAELFRSIIHDQYGACMFTFRNEPGIFGLHIFLNVVFSCFSRMFRLFQPQRYIS